jgi:hypothetical protein
LILTNLLSNARYARPFQDGIVMIAAETFARTILVTINRAVFVEMFDNVNGYTALIKEDTIIITANIS